MAEDQDPYKYIIQANEKIIAQFAEINKLIGIIKYFLPLAKWYCHVYPDKKASLKISEAEVMVSQLEQRRVDENV